MPALTALIDRGLGREEIPIEVSEDLLRRISKHFHHSDSLVGPTPPHAREPMPWPPLETPPFDTAEARRTWDEYVAAVSEVLDRRAWEVVTWPEHGTRPDRKPYARLMQGLAETREYERNLEQYRENTIRHMRRVGASWAEIGQALGVTRQSAHERYRHVEYSSPHHPRYRDTSAGDDDLEPIDEDHPFVGRRQDGIHPPPDTPCVTCGEPLSTHEDEKP